MDKSTLGTMTTETLSATLAWLEEQAQALDNDPRATCDLPAPSKLSELTEEQAYRSMVPIETGDGFAYKPLAECKWSDLTQLREFHERRFQAHQAVKEALELLMLRGSPGRSA